MGKVILSDEFFNYYMNLTLILGPMKSGKSFDLISRFAHLKYAQIPFALFNSAKNTRDKNVFSRNGNLELAAKKISSLKDIPSKDFKIIGIDEIHMFDENDVLAVEKLLKQGVQVVASGLDLDYRGEMFKIIKRLFELGPKEVIYKRAVCEICKIPEAVYTQILKDDQPFLDGLPVVVPEDGCYVYRPLCRHCFVKKSNK